MAHKKVRRVRVTYKVGRKTISYLRYRPGEKPKKPPERKHPVSHKTKEQKHRDKLNRELRQAQKEDEEIRKAKEALQRAKEIVAKEREKELKGTGFQLGLVRNKTLSFLFPKDMFALLNTGKFTHVNDISVFDDYDDVQNDIWEIDNLETNGKYPVIEYEIDFINQKIAWRVVDELDKDDIPEFLKNRYRRNINKIKKYKQ